MSYSVIIPAAGKGTRFSGVVNKLWFELNDGTPVILKTLKRFLYDDDCEQIVLVGSQELIEEFNKRNQYYGKVVITFGGETRQDSIYNGLLACPHGKVLIHDGARPWITREDVHQVVDLLDEYEAVCLTAKISDTVKVIKDGMITETIDRDQLRRALTPQGFDYEVIRRCYEIARKKGLQTTDDAQLYQLVTGKPVRFVDALHYNAKVTTKDDVIGR